MVRDAFGCYCFQLSVLNLQSTVSKRLKCIIQKTVRKKIILFQTLVFQICTNTSQKGGEIKWAKIIPGKFHLNPYNSARDKQML